VLGVYSGAAALRLGGQSRQEHRRA
jgi:hypothetical protein